MKGLPGVADTYITKRKRAKAAYRKRQKGAVERNAGNVAAVDSEEVFGADSDDSLFANLMFAFLDF